VTTWAFAGETLTATGGATVTVAEPDDVWSALEIAFTVTCAGFGTEEGAAYKPSGVMVPQALPEQAAPASTHVTPVLAVPVTVAVKRCLLPTTTVALAGETETPMVNEVSTMALALPDALRSASDVAVIVTIGGFGVFAGAVYSPLDFIWPQAVPLQPAPVTLQTTTLLVVPLTTALNCTWPPGLTCGN
jgi:hypothetical protein